MSLDLPVMLMLLGGAAGLQTLLPGLPGTLLKIPLLPAVALYYALHRQALPALVVAAWSGILLDALGGVPPGTSSLCLLLVALALLLLRRVLSGESWPTAALIGAVVVVLLSIVQAVSLRGRWTCVPGWGALAWGLTISAVAGAVSTVLVGAFARRLDCWAANVRKPEEVAHGR